MKCEYNKFYLLDAIDCQWSSWSKIEDCSKSCGGGSQFFQRRHQVKSETIGMNGVIMEQNCLGEEIKREECNKHKCPGKCFKSE